jgi:hypothetical protein
MSQKNYQRWPLDLRLFAVMAALWATYLAARVLLHDSYAEIFDPLQAVLGGIKFYGGAARAVLLVQAGIFWAIAVGILARRRWGLALALFYMAEVVMSHLIFILAYFNDRGEWMHVRMAAFEGPSMVLITLYLWIRARALLFDTPSNA